MNKSLLSILIFYSCCTFLPGQTISIDTVSIPPFGDVYIYNSHSQKNENIIIMISGDGGWKFGVPEFAKEFTRMNSLVAGVNILQYYKHLSQQKADCYLVASDFTGLATIIERKYNFPDYIPPVVMGYSSGATLVYGILAQARPGTFAGGISLGFCPDIELPKMLCQLNGLTEKELVKGKSFLLLPDAKLGNPWVVLQGKKDKICDFELVNDFVLKTADAKIIALPEVGHDFSKWAGFMPQWKTAYTQMITKFRSDKNINTKAPVPGNIPAIITREKNEVNNNIIAVLFSGDGGWYGFEQSIANHLANDGISTIGIDTKKYFWTRKSPESTASEIAELLKYYMREWNKSQFMLIGYSQGAEIIPFVLTRLPEALKYNVKSLVMLSPESNTDFEVHISNMLGLGNKQNTYDVIAEISGIKKTRQICIFGEDENTEVPGLLKNSLVEIVKIPGSHRYQNNAALIVKMMKEKDAF